MSTYHVWQRFGADPIKIHAEAIQAWPSGVLDFVGTMRGDGQPYTCVVESFAPNQWTRWKIIRDDADTPD